MYIKTKSLIS